MSDSKFTNWLGGATAIPLTALAIAACGSSGSSNVSAVVHPTTANGRGATVGVASEGNLGRILVDAQGRTLYLFKKDTGTKSNCSGACATAWPPLRSNGKPVAGSGAKAALIATTTRSDGRPQATYNGHPLYTFVMDKKSGETNGEGLKAFGARWFAVTRAGNQVQPPTPSGGAAPSRTMAPAAPPSQSAPRTTTPSPPPPAPKPSPAPKQSPPASNGIPQNNGGDQDSDNNGGPDDGDGGV